MRKYSKLSLLIFFIIVSVVLLYTLISIYIIDPLQVFHKSFFNPNTYSYTIRESAKAFIRDYDFDSVILGNSHVENTSARKASEILGGKFINLSMSGSSLNEKHILLKYLLKKKKIKQIVFLMDTQYYKLDDKDTSSFDYLYDGNPLNDIKIYLNDNYFLCALGLKKKSRCKIRRNLNIDCPYYWENKKKYKKRFGGFDKWLENYKQKQISDNFKALLDTPVEFNNNKPSEEYFIKLQGFIDKYLLDTIRNNPNIKFYIIISPVSDLGLAKSIRDENLSYAKTVLLIEMLTKFQAEHKNMELYAFDNLASIGKIEDFKDLTHYRSWINYFILTSIADKKNQITLYNQEQYFKDVYKKAKSVNYNYYLNEIKKIKNKLEK